MEPSTLDVLREIDRELAMRRRVYPEWIRSGRIARQVADMRVNTLEKARRDLAVLYGAGDQRGLL